MLVLLESSKHLLSYILYLFIYLFIW